MIELWHLPLLFLAGLAAGFVDTIAGGGGLITLPVLLSLGLDPAHALGTNKLQSTFGSSSASWHFARAGTVNLKECVRGFAITFVAAMLGAFTVRQLDPSFLNRFIPVLLVALAVYALLKPELGHKDHPPRMSRLKFDVAFGLLIGFYDGFFGPSTGTFWAMAYMLGLGFNLTRATAHTKVMNFTSNVASLAVFLLGGHCQFSAGLSMGLGQLIGARLGSKVVIRKGAKFIRPMFITIALAITARLLWQNFFGTK